MAGITQLHWVTVEVMDHSAYNAQDLLQGWDDPVGEKCLDLHLEAAVAHLAALILADPVLLHTSLVISDLWVTVCFLQIHYRVDPLAAWIVVNIRFAAL